jgi:hypothetical protein
VRISRSQPISRVLLRGARTHPMAVIRLGVALPRRSSHLPADLASSLGVNLFVRLLGVAPDGGCRVSPAPEWREPNRGDSSLWPCSSPSSPARAIDLLRLGVTQHPALRSPDFPLPESVFTGGQRRSGWLRTRMVARGGRRYSGAPRGSSRRQRIVSPARKGTTVCSPNGYDGGTTHASRLSVMVAVLRGRP